MQIPVGHVTPILDIDVRPLVDFDNALKYRSLFTKLGWPQDKGVCYRVHTGYSLLTHALQSAVCSDSFANLRKTPLVDKPTIDCLVFWAPILVPGSTAKTCDEQLWLLGEIREEFDLPQHHLTGFGEASLITCLLGNYWATMSEQERQECALLKNRCIRTDTPIVTGGPRLCLGENAGNGFSCCSPILDEHRDPRVGIFLVGMEMLSSYAI